MNLLMSFNFEFRSIGDNKDLSKLINFLSKQDLGYPNYQDWVMRAESELNMGYKKGTVAYSSGKVVGNLIYQKDKELGRIREIKNLRIHPEVRERYFASFLMRQAEFENKEEFDAIIIDCRKNHNILNFLLRIGYVPIGNKYLYDNHSEDTIMIKTFDKKMESGIFYKTKELILGKK